MSLNTRFFKARTRPASEGPYRVDLKIRDHASGVVWRIVDREALPETKLTLASYIYGCICEDYPDERVVFHDQIGSAFEMLTD